MIARFVGNRAKGRISKQVFEENKARQIFRKTNISYPLIHTRTCAHHGVRIVCFSENLAFFVFLKPRIEIRPFALLPTISSLTPTFQKSWIYLLKWKPFKNDEKCFMFCLKAFFILKISKFLSWNFWSSRKTVW